MMSGSNKGSQGQVSPDPFYLSTTTGTTENNLPLVYVVLVVVVVLPDPFGPATIHNVGRRSFTCIVLFCCLFWRQYPTTAYDGCSVHAW